MVEGTPRRYLGCGLVVLVLLGWAATAIACAPAAWFLGIWSTGWERPAGIVQGAGANPLFGGAGIAMAISYVVLLALASALWIKLIKRIIARYIR